MNILAISADRKLFEDGSAVRQRFVEYGKLVNELHVIVFAKSSCGFKEEKISDNVFVYPTNSLGKLTHALAAIARARVLKRRGVSVTLVSSQDPFEAGIVGVCIARMFRCRLQVQVHTDVMSTYFRGGSLFNRLRVIIASFILPCADGVRVVSQRVKTSIKMIVRPGVPIKVLPIFVEQHKDEQNIPAQKNLKKKYAQFDFIALVVARLSKEKNIESAIRAMVSTTQQHPRVGLIVVGDGPERAALEGLRDHLGLANSVIFEGWQDNISHYYETADVLILPSYYEGYGMVAVEAALAGCPVLMSDVGCAGEVIIDGKNGLILPIGDTEALTEALGHVVSGAVKFERSVPILGSKKEYLVALKESWEEVILLRKEKLCYVLPEYRKDDATHFSHLHDFLKELAKRFDLYLVIEKGESPSAEMGYSKARVLKYRFAPLRFLETVWTMLRVRSLGYSNVYVHYSFLSATVASCIMRPTGGAVMYWNGGEPWKYSRPLLRDIFERNTYRVISYLVTSAQGMRRMYAKYYPISEDRIKVMPNWIDLHRFVAPGTKSEMREKINVPQNAKVVLFAHRLSERKGAHRILPVARKVLEDIPGAMFLIAGDGPLQKDIAESIDKNNMTNIKLLGPISNTLIAGYFTAADVFFMPSDEEGFPRVVLEAMALGLPFVGSDVGVVKDVVSPLMKQYIVDRNDIDGYSQAIKLLLLNDTSDVKKEELDWVQQYDISVAVSRFARMFTE